MRTAIMASALYIGDAIGTPDYSEQIIGIYAFLIVVFIIMDLVDFGRNK